MVNYSYNGVNCFLKNSKQGWQMSSLIIEVCAIEDIAVHPNADRVEKIRVKNWWCIAPKDKYKVGDKVVYLPPDSVLPEELAENWGIAKYCSPLAKNADGERPPKLRIRANRFRGEPSFGCVQDPDDSSWEIGKNVQEYYQIEKWEPPFKTMDGDASPSVPAFHEYTGIENICNFPNILEDGEEVVVTEKIHGMNSRVGYVLYPNETGHAEWQKMAGSHSVRRKEFDSNEKRSRFWIPFDNEQMDNLINKVIRQEESSSAVIVFGELFGQVQDMKYGQDGISFKAFDISVDGKYLDHDKMMGYFSEYEIPTVPLLYRGPFSMEKMNELVDGETTVCDPKSIKEKFKGREGIVIKPTKERYNFDIGGSGRVVLKYISVDYHERKNKNRTEDN